MRIQQAQSSNLSDILKLFYNTIHIINSSNYSRQQCFAWSSSIKNKTRWLNKIDNQYFIIATKKKEIVGFSYITSTGHLDMMYVHHKHQNKGIAKKMLENLIDFAFRNKCEYIYSEVSITAKAFFEKHGFTVQEKQTVRIQDVEMENLKMVLPLFTTTQN